MSAAGEKSPPSLFFFAIYSARQAPPLSPTQPPPSDDDARNILCFHPPTFSVNDQLKHIGLSQALLTFSRTFDLDSDSTSVDVVHSQKHRVQFHEFEPGIWAVLNVNLGFQIRTVAQKRVIEFMDASLHDASVRALLQRACRLFHMQHGLVDSMLGPSGSHNVASRTAAMQVFFARFFDAVEWELVNIGQPAISGVRYFPLDRKSYHDIISLGNALTAGPLLNSTPAGPSAKLIWLHNLQVLWSDLEPQQTETLADYIYSCSPLNRRLMGIRRSTQAHVIEHHGMMTVPESIALTADNVEPFSVHLSGAGNFTALVYQAHETLLVILVETTTATDELLQQGTFYKRLDNALKHPMMVLSTAVQQMQARGGHSTEKSMYRHLLVNGADLSVSTPVGGTFDASVLVSSDLVHCLHDVRTALGKGVTQMCLKTAATDQWIVGDKFGERELYLLVTKRDATLPDLAEELRRLKQSMAVV